MSQHPTGAAVVQSASNHLGGDLFALVWDGRRVHGLNGSGRAPAGLTAAEVGRKGPSEHAAAGLAASDRARGAARLA